MDEATTTEDAKRLKREARALKARRARWLDRAWQVSAKDNDYTNTRDGFNVAIYRHDGHWAACVKDCTTGATRVSERPYPSENAAKLAAFDALVDMLKQREAADRERMVSEFLESRA